MTAEPKAAGRFAWLDIQPKTSMLFRLAGLSALLAGLCYTLVGIFHPANVPASVTTSTWSTVHVIVCAMSFFGVLGLTGLYARQAAQSGWLGLIGYALLTFWMVLVMGFSFVEAFVLPQIATATPAFVDGWMKMFNGGTSSISMGALPTLWTLSGPLYILGGLTFGIATFRAGILPRGAAVLLGLGTVLAPLASQLSLSAQPKIAIPTGVALAWLGFALMTERRAPADERSDETVVAAA
jgi:hypothetical protein